MKDTTEFEAAIRTNIAILAADAAADSPGLADRLITGANWHPTKGSHLRIREAIVRWRGPVAAVGVAAALVATPFIIVRSVASHHDAAAQVSPAAGTSTVKQPPVFAGLPVYAQAPKTTPQSCNLPATATASASASASASAGHPIPLTVDADPVRVTVVWYVPRQGAPCVAPITYGDAELAQKMAQTIRANPPLTPHDISLLGCLDDTGHGMELYFSYAGTSAEQIVTAHIGGCSPLTNPGRESRVFGDLPAELHTIAPAGVSFGATS